MGLAAYMIVAQGDEWGVLHDGMSQIAMPPRRARLRRRLRLHHSQSARGTRSE